jgi:DNA-binding NarL/FixJ family response regulator
MKLIRVLVVAPQALVREGLRVLIDGEQDMCVTHTARSADQASRLTRLAQIHVAVVDIDTLPYVDIGHIAATLRKAAPRLRMIVLASFGSDESIADALAADVHGFVLKEENPSFVRNMIRRVYEGEYCYSRRVRARVVADNGGPATAPGSKTRLELLTDRERQLLRLLATGLSLQRACESLGITYKMADRQKSNLMKKLDIHDRVELARYAIREGIVEP